MNKFRLISKSLWFYKRPYLAVLAGVMVSTAVLTGALAVGDSVRYSLKQLAGMRLGRISQAVQSGDRFFTQKLAVSISQASGKNVVPALLSGGIAINPDQDLRINQVQITGIDDRFPKFWDDALQAPRADEAIIGRNVAARLNLHKGDALLLRIRNQGTAPQDAPFVAEKAPQANLRLTVSGIAEDAQMGRFSLKNDQAAPFNIFISLEQMASLLQIPGCANLLLASAEGLPALHTNWLDSTLRASWQPADAGLHFTKTGNGPEGSFRITTDRIFFDDPTAHAVIRSIPGCEPILTYLVNSISAGKRSTPYSFVTGANASFLKQPLENREIIVNDWLAKDLGVVPGDSVILRYFIMGPMRSLREDSTRFIVRSVIPVSADVSDPSLMPDFPGMSDAGNCRDWETGAPVNLKKIREKDEQYWTDHRGTPKAFIPLETAKLIWGNRFGTSTEFRFRAGQDELQGIKRNLMAGINPARFGLSFRQVYAEGQAAAQNSTDFGELFLSLSFFIQVSALLLTAMLFYLLAGMRMAEAGVLSSLGISKQTILSMLAAEAIIVIVAGTIPGILGGILYNHLLILGLNTIWMDAVNTSLLVAHAEPFTLIAGALSAIVVAMIVLLVVLWSNLRQPLSLLVKGENVKEGAKDGRISKTLSAVIAVLCFGTSIAIFARMMFSPGEQDSAFILSAGGLVLAGGWALVNFFLSRRDNSGKNVPGFSGLILKNLALDRSRTISAIALLSLGTFAVIITGANKKTLYGTGTSRQSGTGGFMFWAESSMPLMYDLNTDRGAEAFGLRDEKDLRHLKLIQLSHVNGDDASCLNLNQVARPGLTGIPVKTFDSLGVFSLLNSRAGVNKEHPWKMLSGSMGPSIIPGFADQTVITWGLRKSVGDTLFYRDESGGILKIKLMGGLDNSIFQGSVLISDSLLRHYFPSNGGSTLILIDGEPGSGDRVPGHLERIFRDYGMMVTPAAQRLASFNAVENTYLSVFMFLGGLGMILGTIGLGIVLLRNIARRRKELAIYVALGFRKDFVMRLILAEHVIILVSGLLLGFLASLPGILPVAVGEGSVPWLFITGLMVLILANGFLWIWLAARTLLKKNLITAMREE